jgi:hypothetical protein
MDIAELRSKLDSIAAELAEQDVQQEDIAIEEEQVEEVELPIEEADIDEAHCMGGKKRKKNEDVEEFAEEDDLDIDEAHCMGGKKRKKMEGEEEVEETVEVSKAALAELMQLAGYENYADKLAEYENEPSEEYMDAEQQYIGLSGGLNGPKKMFAPAADGDNPMDQEPRKVEEDESIATLENNLYKSYKDFLEEAEIQDDA